MKKILYCLILALFSFVEVKAQDPQFTQYYAAPLYLNPGFTGTSIGHRLIMNHRNQWPGLSNNFSTYAFSYDYNIHDLKSGVGLLVTTDKAGAADLKSTSLNFMYSYKVYINKKMILSSGLYFGYSNRNIDFSKLVFGDQLDFDATASAPSNDPSFGLLNGMGYFDLGTGAIVYGEKYWFGVSAYHVNTPQMSLLDNNSILPTKASVHGGFRMPLYHGAFKKDKVSSIAPSFVYKKQGEFDQLDLGLHFLYEPVMIGLWYRGIPIQQSIGNRPNSDAIAFFFGLHFEPFSIEYSYDFTVSALGPSSGGAHEVSVLYRVQLPHHEHIRRKDKYLHCPTFHK